jgi:hypothetical protein
MTMTHRRKRVPTSEKAKTTCQHWPVPRPRVSNKDANHQRRDPRQEPRQELTDAALLKPCEGFDAVPRLWLVEDLNVAGAVDGALGAPELNGNDNQADQPEDEKHKGANHHNGRKQLILRHEPDQHEDPEDDERRDGDVVGKVPARCRVSST